MNGIAAERELARDTMGKVGVAGATFTPRRQTACDAEGYAPAGLRSSTVRGPPSADERGTARFRGPRRSTLVAIRALVVGLFALTLGLSPRQGLAAEPQRAAAQATVATGPTAPPARATPELWSRLSIKADGGVALVPRQSVGGYARLGAELALSEDPVHARFVWGIWDAYEGWFGDEAGGFAIPFVVFAGYRAPPFVASVGAGGNLLTIDHLAGDTGAGILSPRAEARVGLDFGPAFLLATSGVQRRWMWGRDDVTLVQAGLSIGLGRPFERPLRAAR